MAHLYTLFLIVVSLMGINTSINENTDYSSRPPSNKNGHLLAVFLIFRHGDRNPERFYPTDPYQYSHSVFPEGLAELTNQGKQRHYALGGWFRRRYRHFLPALYSPKDIYIRSSDIDRCIMSAGAHLAGLYPPMGYQIWNPDLLWLPMPIHTVPTTEDSLALMSKPCSKRTQLLIQRLESEEIRAVDELNKDLYAYLTKYTGRNVTTLRDCLELYDTLFVEEQNGLTLPKWTRPVYPDKLRELANFAITIPASTPDLARLQAGPLIDRINTNFRKIAANASDPGAHKYFILSAHDITIASVLTALGISISNLPMYASTIIFELREGSKGNKFVNILYKQNTDPVTQPEPIRLSLNGCKFNCDIDSFAKLTEPVSTSPKQWEQECRRA